MTTTTASDAATGLTTATPPPDAPPARTTWSARHFVDRARGGVSGRARDPGDERVLVAADHRPARVPRVPALGRRVLLPPTGERRWPTASSSSTPSATSSTGSRWRAPATRRSTRPISRCGRSWVSTASRAHRVASGLLGVAAVVVVGLVGRKVAGTAVGLIAAAVISRCTRSCGSTTACSCRNRSSCW